MHPGNQFFDDADLGPGKKVIDFNEIELVNVEEPEYSSEDKLAIKFSIINIPKQKKMKKDCSMLRNMTWKLFRMITCMKRKKLLKVQVMSRAVQMK